MRVTIVGAEHGCRMVFEGCLTYTSARASEDQIINAMRVHSPIDVDLSGISEIDLSGFNLLGVMQAIGGDQLRVVAASPVVEQASQRFLVSQRGCSLGRVARNANVASAHP